MLMIGRMLTMAVALLGGIFFSQAPEFTQQYRQRIGGALDELRILITEFDAQAGRNGLDRIQALDKYARSPEIFLRNQGEAMMRTFVRYERLSTQQDELAEAAPLAKPFVVMRSPDMTTFANAWRDFIPAVPVNIPGLAWAAAGLFCGWLLAAGCGTAGRHVVKRARRKRVIEAPAVSH